MKNYLRQVLRLRKHLLLYYSRVSNCSTESMVFHKINVALAEFGNFETTDWSHVAAVSDSMSRCSGANVVWE